MRATSPSWSVRGSEARARSSLSAAPREPRCEEPFAARLGPAHAPHTHQERAADVWRLRSAARSGRRDLLKFGSAVRAAADCGCQAPSRWGRIPDFSPLQPNCPQTGEDLRNLKKFCVFFLKVSWGITAAYTQRDTETTD